MSVQGYTLTFKPKKRVNHDGAVGAFDKLRELLEALVFYIRGFMPLGIRAGDGIALNAADHETALKKLSASLDNMQFEMPCRVICAPATELKSRQREILRELERIPVHRNAHGFVPGRNALTCAQAHLSYWGERPKGLVLLNVDVEGFFHSVSQELVAVALEKHGVKPGLIEGLLNHCVLRATPELAVEVIKGLGQAVGISKPTLKTLTQGLTEILCWDNINVRAYSALILKKVLGLGSAIQLDGGFLPQGAPTSPVLSNLVCKIVDIRLTALAKAFGAFYTRYADDLTFSWPTFTKGKEIDGLKRCTAEVLAEYGMVYNKRKIRVVGPGGSQDIVGYVINSGRPTVSQKYRSKLRQSIEDEQSSKSKTSQVRIEQLIGQAGYIQPLHPKEAHWFKGEIEKLRYKTNRKVAKVSTHEESIEPPAPTPRRKVASAS